jgi:hypothetical protein
MNALLRDGGDALRPVQSRPPDLRELKLADMEKLFQRR